MASLKKFVVGLMVAGVSTLAVAVPVVLQAAVTGDPRPGTPNNLLISVSISFDTTSNTADWVVDINSPAHPNAKLDEFYFNIVGTAADYTFSGYNPVGWAINSPASTAGGGTLSPNFMFEAADPAGPPNAADVTNTQTLSFTMTKLTGNFSSLDFLNAVSSCSTDTLLGCGQVGAHLQALTNPDFPTITSAFLLGNYREGRTPPQEQVPEPGSMLLAGVALLAAAGARRRAAKRRPGPSSA